MLFGLLQPVILIPESIAVGNQSSLRFCLAHEWSHVRCHDLPKWYLINLCQIALWYQPVFWMLRQELRICQDLLADDHATAESKGQLARIEYSELLLSIASGVSFPRTTAAIAFYDRSSQLTRRIKLLLANDQSLQSRSTQAFIVLSGILLLMISMAISSVRLGTVQGQESSPDEPVTTITGGDNMPAATSGQVAKDNNARIVRGQVVNAAGKPVPNAKLWLPLQMQPRRTVEATADDTGKFELICPDGWISPSSSKSFWTVWVYAPGYSIQSQSVYDVVRRNADKEYTIQLPPESSTNFRVLTQDGQPLSDVLVKPQNYKTSVAYELIPEEMMTIFQARTSGNGLVTLPAIESGPLFRIEMLHEKFGRQIIRVDSKIIEAERVVRLRPIASIKGRLASENPEWVRNVKLVFTTELQQVWNETEGVAEVVTDGEGNFQVPMIASGGPLHTYVRVNPELLVRPKLSEDVFLTAGETFELEIPLVDVTVVCGKVVAKSTSQPVANAEVLLGYGSSDQRETVTTDENGEYEGRVLPGRVSVQIVSLPDGLVQLGTPWDKPYQVPANIGSFELPAIELVGSHEIEGLLIGVDDKPLPNVKVHAINGNRRYGFGKSDSEGRFKMRVPDGIDTELRVYLEKRGSAPVQVVQDIPLVVKYVSDDRKK
jgi:hypothetical protein